MNRLTLVWMFVIVVAAFMLYQAKYAVQSLQAQVSETTHQLEAEKESLHVVAAEWAYLNRPARLKELASKYLGTSDMTVGNIASIQTIPFPTLQQAALTPEELKPAAPEAAR